MIKSITIPFVLFVIICLVGITCVLAVISISAGAFEISVEQKMHPCQKVILDNYWLYQDNAIMLQAPNIEPEVLAKYQEDLLEKEKKHRQIAVDYNCGDLDPEWYTPEFIVKLVKLLDQ